MSDQWEPCDARKCSCNHHTLPSPFPSTDLVDPAEYNHLFSSNDRPSPTADGAIHRDIDQLRDALTSAQRQLDKLRLAEENMKKQLSEMKKCISGWTGLEVDINACIDARKALLHPVRRLSPDILDNIFHFAVARVPVPDDSMSRAQWQAACSFKDPESPLWALSGTCGLWRTLIVESPNLWAYIAINIAKRHMASVSYFFRLSLQLHRSRNAAELHLSIGTPDRGVFLTRTPEIPKKLVYLLLPLSWRISQLDLFLPLSAVHSLHPLRGMFTSLRRVDYISMPGDPHSSKGTALFRDAPRLETVRLANAHTPAEDFSWPETVRTLVIEDSRVLGVKTKDSIDTNVLNYAGHQELISAYKHLAHLKVCAGEWRYENAISVPIGPSRPELRTVDIISSAWCQGILRCFTVPSLTSLRLSIVESVTRTSRAATGVDEALPELVDFLERCEPPIRTLRLEGIRSNADAFAQLVGVASTLTELCLVGYADLARVVELLGTPAYPLTQLRTLDLRGNFGSAKVLLLATRIMDMWEETRLDDLRLQWEGKMKKKQKRNPQSSDESESEEDGTGDDETDKGVGEFLGLVEVLENFDMKRLDLIAM